MSMYSQHSALFLSLQERIRTKTDLLKQLDRKVTDATTALELQKSNKATLEAELSSKFTSALSAEEKTTLENLDADITAFEAEVLYL